MERNTIQKQQIMEILMNCNIHPTIKELCDIVHKKYSNIGQATVYRTINKLVKDGVVQKIECSKGICYDYNREHFHIYCIKCHKIKDIFLPDFIITKLLSFTSPNEVLRFNLVFEGICKECKKKDI